MSKFVENLCTRCWGRCSVDNRVTCPRCKGTGEEPDWFSWPTIAVCIVILVVGLFAIWSIK